MLKMQLTKNSKKHIYSDVQMAVLAGKTKKISVGWLAEKDK